MLITREQLTDAAGVVELILLRFSIVLFDLIKMSAADLGIFTRFTVVNFMISWKCICNIFFSHYKVHYC